MEQSNHSRSYGHSHGWSTSYTPTSGKCSTSGTSQSISRPKARTYWGEPEAMRRLMFEDDLTDFENELAFLEYSEERRKRIHALIKQLIRLL